jgi:hypothetical protein
MVEQVTEKTKQSSAKSGKAEQARKRIPLGTRNVLTAPKKPGFVRRFVNDTGDRISHFEAAGWKLVDEDVQVGDPKVGRPSMIGSKVNPHVGGGQRAVLMELPEEIYAEDRAKSQEKITQVENEIRRNSKKPGNDGLNGEVSIS